jgi:hypothetical protein
MAVATTKAGPYYASGAISFSSLRSNFRAQRRKTTSGGSETFITDNASISASQLLRNTSTTSTSPNVPNATENSNIAPSQSNWKTSQFRNSVKFFYITQSSTNTNFDMDDLAWNGNLNKNINKFLFVTGTCGSSSVSSVAASFNATAYNLTFDVTGSILGAGGRGGGTSGAPDPSGEGGGTAMSVSSSSGRNVVVLVRSGARIYGGGGGGERGAQGANGGGGRCYNETTTSGCGSAPGCPGGYSDRGTWGGGCCQSTCDWCWGCCQRCVRNTQYRRCVQEYNTSGGTGGAGGTGGPGRGYNNQAGSLAGAGGSGGSGGGGCGAQSGQTGETGGAGGDWATSGANTNNSGNGGGGARAISGSNYSVSGTINSSTVKGAYNP